MSQLKGEEREAAKAELRQKGQELAERSALVDHMLPPRNAIPRNLRDGSYRGGRRPILRGALPPDAMNVRSFWYVVAESREALLLGQQGALRRGRRGLAGDDVALHLRCPVARAQERGQRRMLGRQADRAALQRTSGLPPGAIRRSYITLGPMRCRKA
mgnify:CR=1 FL=1